MKHTSKLLAMLMAASMAFGLAACGSNGSAPSTGDNDTTPAGDTSVSDNSGSTDGKVYKIGICQLMQHQALDAATQGFEDALTDLLGAENVDFDLQNAQGDSPTCSTIVTGFVSNGYDLILANATPALQAAVSATDEVPIVGTSITDYATALAYTDWDGTTGINVTGTSDLAPLDQQAAMIHELVPDVTKVAIVYCSAEANSVYQANKVQEYLADDGIDSAIYTFSDSNDMQSVITNAIAECDAVYIPTDNTAASNMTIVANVCDPAGIPVICGEENMTKAGGLATLSISYYDIGYAAGEMAYDILVNGADPATMEIGTATATTKEYNPVTAEAINWTIPDDYAAIEMD